MKNIMITCDEATTLSDKKQYRAASFWEQMKLGFHLMMCKKCLIYDKQNAIITKVLEYKTICDKQEKQKLSKKDKTKMGDAMSE